MFNFFQSKKNQEPECDFVDIHMEAESVEITDGNARIRAKVPGKNIGFEIVVKDNTSKVIFNENNNSNVNLVLDGVIFKSLGQTSDEFLSYLCNRYKLLKQDVKMIKEVSFTSLVLEGNPADIIASPVRFKLFFEKKFDDTNSNEIDLFYQNEYFEIFLNIDLSNKKVELTEKDIEYRSKILQSLSSKEKFDFKIKENVASLVETLKKAGVIFKKGLTDEEIQLAEEKFNFKFPPDLKLFLQFALPARMKGEFFSQQPAFPNWRELDEKYFEYYDKSVLEGILFDFEDNNFWLEELGPKPENLNDAKKILIEAVKKAPKLIPIYGHRFFPAEPSEENNPVLSIMQTDIIYYGTNLYDYFMTEFAKRKHFTQRKDLKLEDFPKRIRFWSSIIDSY